jgi:PAS domain S-box-containing protein
MGRGHRENRALAPAPAALGPAWKRREWLSAGVAAALAATPVRAQPRKAIRYGGDADFAPFESLDPQGRPHGFQVDLLREIARELDIDIDVTLKPWARTVEDFRAGRVDLVAMVDTKERRQWALFARDHATPAFTLYRRRDRAELQSLQDMATLRVAVLDGEPMQETLRLWFSGIAASFVPFPDADRALSAVQQGQVDLALLPRAYGDPLMARPGHESLAAGQASLRLQPYAFAVSPGDTELLGLIQRTLDTMEGDGRLEALRRRWLSSHRGLADLDRSREETLDQRRATWAVGVAAAAALMAAGLVLRRRTRRLADESRLRREAQSALQQAQAVLDRSFTRHPDPMLVVSRDTGIVRDANAATLDLLGVAADALIGHRLADKLQHLDPGALKDLVSSLVRDGVLDAATLRLARGDGAVRTCLVSASPLAIEGSEHVFCLVRDVTEQMARDEAMREGYAALEAELARSREAGERALQAQSRAEVATQDFTRAVAHDLRTPLNAVQGFAGLLGQRLTSGHWQEAAHYSEQIERAARRMDSMIVALSGLARVGKEPLNRSYVDMTGLAKDIWALIVAAEPARRMACQIESLPGSHADPALVAQIWQNLLHNAWKYSARSADAKVSVDSFRDDRGTWYRVTDNGAGFDMSKAGRLFMPFQRLHSAADFAGTGVGLSVVRRIVDLHGGDIRLRSSPGVGTIVEFTLETQQAAVPG